MKAVTIKIAAVIITILLIFILVKYIKIFHSNYNGFCAETHEKLSDQEKINLAVDKLLQIYPKSEQDLQRYIKKTREIDDDDSAVRVRPIAYADRKEFFVKNKECCKVIHQAEDVEDVKATFFDRIIGSKMDFVVVNYTLRYVGFSSEVVEKRERVVYAITNCGVVWDGI